MIMSMNIVDMGLRVSSNRVEDRFRIRSTLHLGLLHLFEDTDLDG